MLQQTLQYDEIQLGAPTHYIISFNHVLLKVIWHIKHVMSPFAIYQWTSNMAR